jgi:hypothetical protein
MEVGRIESSREVTIFIPQVPPTVHNCIAPKPKIEPNIENILFVPD